MEPLLHLGFYTEPFSLLNHVETSYTESNYCVEHWGQGWNTEPCMITHIDLTSIVNPVLSQAGSHSLYQSHKFINRWFVELLLQYHCVTLFSRLGKLRRGDQILSVNGEVSWKSIVCAMYRNMYCLLYQHWFVVKCSLQCHGFCFYIMPRGRVTHGCLHLFRVCMLHIHMIFQSDPV